MMMRNLIVVALVVWSSVLTASALDPLSFEEISLLLRVGEHPTSVLKEVEKRKILRPLTPQQVSALKASGVSDALLNELQRPERIAPPETAAAVELKKRRLMEAKVTPGASSEPALKTNQPTIATPIPIGGKDLFIEKIVILKDPIHQPFHVFFKVSANAGRTEASHHIPGKTYLREGIEPRVEIPVNLVLKGVQENDWATVTLHLDPNRDAVTTFGALKRHTARIPIVDKPLYAEPFEFDPPRATFIVSLNTNQEFVYQVYWKIR